MKIDIMTFLNSKLHRCLGRLQGIFMLIGLSKPLIFSIASTLITLVIQVIDWFVNGENSQMSVFESLALIVAFFSGGYTILDGIVTYYSYAHGVRMLSAKDSKPRIHETWKLSDKELEDKYEIAAFYNGDCYEYYTNSDLVNQFLQSGSSLGFNYIRLGYTLPLTIRQFVPVILENMFSKPGIVFNGKLLRQASHISIMTATADIQRVRYFQGQCSHEIVYKRFVTPDAIGIAFDGKELLMDENDRLYDLTCSPNANFLGASTIVVTRKHIIIVKQGRLSKANQERYAPSGSGSVELTDIKGSRRYYRKGRKNHTLNDILTYAMEREFCEECSFKHNQIKSLISTALIGFTRLLERGGKPDYFGLSYLDIDLSECDTYTHNRSYFSELGLTESAEQLEYDSISDIPTVLERFIASRIEGAHISIQLYLLAKYLREMKERGTLEGLVAMLKSDIERKKTIKRRRQPSLSVDQ